MRQLVEAETTATAEGLLSMLKKAYHTATPKVRTKDGSIPYWWTAEIAERRKETLTAGRKLGRLRGRQTADPGSIREAFERYRELRKKLRTEIAASKRRCWSHLLNELENDAFGDGYKIVKRGMNIKHPTLEITDQERERVVSQLFPQAPEAIWVRNATENPTPFTSDELRVAARKLKNKRAPGRDGIPAEAVKAAVDAAEGYILAVMNNLLSQGVFPTAWKKATLVLIEKPMKAGATRRTYRPICLIDTLGKLYEHLIAVRLSTDIEIRGGLSNLQFGFRKGRSTVQAIDQVLSFSKTAHRGNPSL